jgi:hypothetical protein
MTRYYLQRLQAFHSKLEAAVREELARPRPDHARLVSLKRRKLAVKDQLAGIAPARC